MFLFDIENSFFEIEAYLCIKWIYALFHTSYSSNTFCAVIFLLFNIGFDNNK